MARGAGGPHFRAALGGWIDDDRAFLGVDTQNGGAYDLCATEACRDRVVGLVLQYLPFVHESFDARERPQHEHGQGGDHESLDRN
jgi:hypothetical protein